MASSRVYCNPVTLSLCNFFCLSFRAPFFSFIPLSVGISLSAIRLLFTSLPAYTSSLFVFICSWLTAQGSWRLCQRAFTAVRRLLRSARDDRIGHPLCIPQIIPVMSSRPLLPPKPPCLKLRSVSLVIHFQPPF